MRLFKNNRLYFRYFKEKLEILVKENSNYFIISNFK